MRKIWRNDSISLKVKTRLYGAIILSTLLYGADVWPLTAILTKITNMLSTSVLYMYTFNCLTAASTSEAEHCKFAVLGI